MKDEKDTGLGQSCLLKQAVVYSIMRQGDELRSYIFSNSVESRWFLSTLDRGSLFVLSFFRVWLLFVEKNLWKLDELSNNCRNKKVANHLIHMVFRCAIILLVSMASDRRCKALISTCLTRGNCRWCSHHLEWQWNTYNRNVKLSSQDLLEVNNLSYDEQQFSKWLKSCFFLYV